MYDLSLLATLYVQDIIGIAREYAENVLKTFRQLIEIRDKQRSTISDNKKLNEALDILFTNVEEDYHAKIESGSALYLNNIVNKDISFYSNPDDNWNFNLFLTTQYMRTKNIRDSILSQIANKPDILASITRSMSVLRFLVSPIFAAGLSAHSDEYCMYLLLNE